MTRRTPTLVIAELLWSGHHHTPLNAALVEAAHRAFPQRRVLYLAEAGQRAEVAANLGKEASGAVELLPVDEGALGEAWRRHRRSLDRNAHPLVRVRQARALLRALVSPEGPLATQAPVDLVLTSAEASLLLAARKAARRERGLRRVEVVIHGNLADAVGWCSHRPLWRHLDLRSALERWARDGRQLSVLEPHIADELGQVLPRLAAPGRIAVIPHPVTGRGLPSAGRELGSPLQVGFLGLGTWAKGLDLFVGLARQLGGPDREDLRFRVAGALHRSLEALDLGALADPLTLAPLPRDAYEAVLGQLHYVCLPLRGEYYRFSASGTVMDAIEQLVPLLTLEGPLSHRLFQDAGDIGHLCRDPEHLAGTVDELAHKPDPVRYRAQVENLKRLRDSRTPRALAPRLRELWGEG